MRIAFISYEFPPDTAFGGIATYVRQAARLLARSGNEVEVFTASTERHGSFPEDGCIVHRILSAGRDKFALEICEVFGQRLSEVEFDVVESPEYFADGSEIMMRHRHIPHVVKLHTPSSLIHELSRPSACWRKRLVAAARYTKYAIQRRMSRQETLDRDDWELVSPSLQRVAMAERNATRNADLVLSPSKSLAEWAIKRWKIEKRRVQVIPYPYEPSQELLSASTGPKDNEQIILGYFGRLERRKGIDNLIPVLETSLRKHPKLQVRLVGKSQTHLESGLTYDSLIRKALSEFAHRIELVGNVPLDTISALYRDTDICIFPSLWENFPNVCLEAMSAGRAIIGSRNGGMREMLEDGCCGLVVDPNSTLAMENAIDELVSDPNKRQAFGENA